MILRRVAHLVVVLFFVTLFVATLTSLLPGDPVDAIAGFASPEQKEALREDLQLDDPVYVQYGRWVGNFVTGDLGNYYSVTGGRPVMDRVRDALPVSLQLMVEAQILALIVAIPLGGYRLPGGVALRQVGQRYRLRPPGHPQLRRRARARLLRGREVRGLPVSGYVKPSDDLVEHLRRMAMPAIALAVGQIAVYMRLLRSDMIATLQEDFILMAKSKGISPSRVLWRYALRPSSLTLLTVAGLNVGVLIGGAVIVEVIFSLPGIGTLLYEAINARQYIALQSLVAIIAVGYVLINFLVDVLYAVLDPRIRHARA